MFTSRRLRATRAALRSAHAKGIAKTARIRELELNLAAAQDHAQALARSRGDVAQVLDLEKQLKQQAETISQLRRGVVDDRQTAELRRQLAQEKRANRDLHDRLAVLQAANSGVAEIRVIA
ncbi:hypothetical protein ACFTWD_09325 [Streptomyces sp. NPDC056943]|uniref:hypothetical protein n=1 Tax=Streptomyces sp. NPDC056943 TaxID=3345971 RepID=UPI003638007D